MIEHFGLFEKPIVKSRIILPGFDEKNSTGKEYYLCKQNVARFFETYHYLDINFAYNFFMKNQIMNALVAASVRCFCCVHKFIDFA